MARHGIVIVGAGLAGAATAWHLRRRGVADLLVLEREAVPGAHSSGRNAAIVRERMDDPRMQPLAAESVAVLREETLARYRRTGGYLLGLDTGPDEAGDPVRARVPPCQGTGRFQPDDGVVDVAGLLHAYLRGTPVRLGTAVEEVDARPDGVRLATSDGLVEADVVVNAAGAWAGALGGLPLTPTDRHLFVSEPDPAIGADWPYVWDAKAGYYLRPESGGLLLCACDETPSTPGESAVDPRVAELLATKLAAHQPALADLEIRTAWSGQRTFAPDRLPVIGFDAHRPRLFHVAGLGGHGVTLSYAVGALAAALLTGASPARLYDPGRFAPARA